MATGTPPYVRLLEAFVASNQPPLLPADALTGNNVVKISKDLLGKLIWTCLPLKANDATSEPVLTAARIVETEAYAAPEDRASHAYSNGVECKKTKRNRSMFLEGGHSYVYLCYGIHICMNITTNRCGSPHAVLIRGTEPVVGFDFMAQRRSLKGWGNSKSSTQEYYDGVREKDMRKAVEKLLMLGAGPACVSQVLGLTMKEDGLNIIQPPSTDSPNMRMWLTEDPAAEDTLIQKLGQFVSRMKNETSPIGDCNEKADPLTESSSLPALTSECLSEKSLEYALQHIKQYWCRTEAATVTDTTASQAEEMTDAISGIESFTYAALGTADDMPDKKNTADTTNAATLTDKTEVTDKTNQACSGNSPENNSSEGDLTPMTTASANPSVELPPNVGSSARVGVGYAQEDSILPYRFFYHKHPSVSKGVPSTQTKKKIKTPPADTKAAESPAKKSRSSRKKTSTAAEENV
eukprot:GHVN01073283.1.p1 GENE.GHVN01073283.1~~GHVN01073283.1.p1  ORF type:complete len:465 (+),score=66.24 GHVN01073283.1:1248-2642(+)